MKNLQHFIYIALSLIALTSQTLHAAEKNRLSPMQQIEQANRQVVRLFHQGNYIRAKSLAKQVVEFTAEQLGTQHPIYAITINNLAELYRVTGDYPQAEPLYRQALKIYKTNLGEQHPDYAVSLNNLAGLYRSMGDYPQAEPLYRQAIEIHKVTLGEKHPDYATSINNLAVLYHYMDNYPQAELLYRKALTIRRVALSEQHPDYVNTLSNLASLYHDMGDYTQVEPLYRQIMEIRKTILGEQHPDYAVSLSNLAELYRLMGDYANAEPLFRQALKIRKITLGEQHPDYATNLNSLAALYFTMGDYPHAKLLYHQALDIQKTTLGEYHPDYAVTINNLAVFYYSLGDYLHAKVMFRQDLEISAAVWGEDHSYYASSLNNLAEMYQLMGDYLAAEPLFRQALAINKTVFGKQHPKYASSLNNLATLHYKMGDYPRAEPLYRRALGIRKTALGEQHPDYADSLNNLALLYDDIGSYSHAALFYRQALEIKKNILGEQHPSYALSLNNLAFFYKTMGDYLHAKPLYREALKILKTTLDKQHPDYAKSLNNLADLYKAMGDYSHAEPLYRQALAIHKSALGKQHPDYATSLNNLAGIYSAMGNYQRAEPLYRQALKIFKTTLGKQHPDYAASLSNLGMFYYDQKQFSNSIPLFATAMNIMDLLRSQLGQERHRLTFLPKYLGTYEIYLKSLSNLHQHHPDQNHHQKAFEVFERKQGRVFLEQMGESGTRNFAGIPQAVLDQETGLDSQIVQTQTQLTAERSKLISKQNKTLINNLEKRLQQLQSEMLQLQRTIRTHYPAYHALRNPKPVNLAHLQKRVLKANEMLLVYNVSSVKMGKKTEDIALLWFITQDKFELFDLPLKPADLENRVTALYRTFAARGDQVLRGRKLIHDPKLGKVVPWQTAAHELYQDLIPASVRPHLKGKTLYVVPTDVLYRLPFEALITQKEKPRYLIEDTAVSYLSSASLLKIIRDARARRRDEPKYPLLAFANPVYDSPDSSPQGEREQRGLFAQAYADLFQRAGLRPLPETAAEAKAIAQVLEAPAQSTTGVATLQLGDDARKSRLFAFNDKQYLDDYRYLLFAMHGVFTKVDKLTQPALALSYPDNDGYLTMADIFGLQLNADFIMLSACNTGGGDPAGAGEGIRGLTGAFMYAGTPAVAVTLWSVETHSAKAMSTEIFRQLHRGLPVAEALRAAKLKMLRGESEGGDDWRHPFFWAAFTGFGDGSITRYSRDNPQQVAALLAATGYFTGRPETADWAELRAALEALQKDLGLPQTGRMDAVLWEKLRQVRIRRK